MNSFLVGRIQRRHDLSGSRDLDRQIGLDAWDIYASCRVRVFRVVHCLGGGLGFELDSI